jgi:hypothetical protein
MWTWRELFWRRIILFLRKIGFLQDFQNLPVNLFCPAIHMAVVIADEAALFVILGLDKMGVKIATHFAIDDVSDFDIFPSRRREQVFLTGLEEGNHGVPFFAGDEGLTSL